jgi:hypothetical protein
MANNVASEDVGEQELGAKPQLFVQTLLLKMGVLGGGARLKVGMLLPVSIEIRVSGCVGGLPLFVLRLPANLELLVRPLWWLNLNHWVVGHWQCIAAAKLRLVPFEIGDLASQLPNVSHSHNHHNHKGGRKCCNSSTAAAALLRP